MPLFVIGCDGNDPSEDSDTDPVVEQTTTGTGTGVVDATGSGSGHVEQAFFTEPERQTILDWLGPLPDNPPPDPSNAYAEDPAAAALGQALFFDTGYSENDQIACATCHAPTSSFDDPRANTSLGLAYTPRSAMPVTNGAFGAASEDQHTIFQFWDGRCDSQWSQALQPPESAAEMGSSRTTVALHLYDNYRGPYEAVFGPMPQLRDASGAPLIPEKAKPGDEAWEALPPETKSDVNRVYANFGKAIAAYERNLQSRNSRFDALWWDLQNGASDSDHLTDLEKEGLRVFIGVGRCLGCHGGPNFTDGQFHNIAVAQRGNNIPATDEGRAVGIARLLEDEFNCAGEYSDHPNKAQCAVNGLDPSAGEMGAFKTPTLRGVSASAPYMHTGEFNTLAEVISHYDLGGAPHGTFQGARDELMRPLGLTAPQRDALVAFLMALDGEPLDPQLMGPPQ